MTERPDRSSDRLEAFSDGVFAVAIPANVKGGLGPALLREWPHYATFVVSFATIGIIWVNHHSHFERIATVDRTLMFLNLFLLMTVTAIPFPTSLLADNLHTPADQHIAAAVYAGTLMTMGLAFFSTYLWTTRRGLFEDWVDDGARRYLIKRNGLGSAAYVGAIGLALLNAPLSLAVCGAIAVYFIFPGRT